MKTPLLLLGLALACALWAPDAEASTIFRTQNNLGLARGLVGWWNFDGKTVSGTRVFDASGNGNYGTMTNGPTITEGKLGQGMAFDGADDYVDIANISNFSSLSSGTIAGWFNTPSIECGNSSDMLNFSKGSDGQNLLFIEIACDTPNYVRVLIRPNAGQLLDLSTGANTFKFKTWHHVTYVSDSDGNSVYLDGIKQSVTYANGSAATQAFYSNITSPNYHRLGLGRFDGSDRRPFNGLLDDVRIYNRALSADEVKRLYKIGATAKLGVAASNSSLSQGLVGWWNFDGKTVSGTRVFDASGTGNYGTMTNGPTITEGKLGQGMSFDGSDDYVDVGNPSALQITGNMSISAWFKTNGSFAAQQGIANKDDGSSNRAWFLIVRPSDIAFKIDRSGVEQLVTTTNQYDDSQWHHVVAINNGTDLLIYVDGVPGNSSGNGKGGTITNASTNMQIGTWRSDERFPGLLDDVRIYNRALSADEVKRLYNLGSTMKLNASMSNSKDSLAKGLVGWWTFDGKDVSGVQVYDKSGNNNRGILTNGPTITEGKLGQGMQFDGGDDYVDAGNPSSLQLTGSMTLSAWVRFSKDPAAVCPCRIIDKGASGDQGWSLDHEGAGFSFEFQIADAAQTIYGLEPATTIKPNVWYHVVAVYNASASSMHTYLNGAVDESGSVANVPSSQRNSGQNVSIGQRASGAQRFPGLLDDVRIYNRALSADEVKRLYTMGR